MERYIGLAAPGTSCTLAVIGPSGKTIRQDVIETHGAALVSSLRNLPGRIGPAPIAWTGFIMQS